MKKIIITFFVFFLLLVSCSEPINQTKQNLLIQQNQIKIGMNCKNLSEILGGYRAITFLYLEKKDLAPTLENSYLLLSTASDNTEKNYFLCERTRVDNIRIRQKIKKHIYDYDLIKIFKEPTVMIKYVLSVTSEYTRMYILSRVNLLDYNLTRAKVSKILDDVVELETEIKEEELKKAEELLKEEIKKEKLNIPEDEDQKTLREKLLKEINNK